MHAQLETSLVETSLVDTSLVDTLLVNKSELTARRVLLAALVKVLKELCVKRDYVETLDCRVGVRCAMPRVLVRAFPWSAGCAATMQAAMA